MKLTEAEIEAAKTPKGGWTRKQLEEWGVAWPPPRGWKRRLTAKESRKPRSRPAPPPPTIAVPLEHLAHRVAVFVATDPLWFCRDCLWGGRG